MNKKRLIIIVSLVVAVSLSSFVLFKNKKEEVTGGMPEWVPKNLQEEIKSLDVNKITEPQIKLLMSEIQSIQVKDPKNPPQSLIKK